MHPKRNAWLNLGRWPALLLLAGMCFVSHAQVQIPLGADPAVIQKREQEREQKREQRQRLEDLQNDRIDPLVRPAVSTNVTPASGEGVPFVVHEIRFTSISDILTSEELNLLAVQYLGRRITIKQLNELINRINDLYRAKGVVTAQASLPTQDVTDGEIRIRLIEGRVGNIRIDGNTSTRESYVADRIKLKQGMLVDLPTLESDLLRFNRSNDAQLRASMRPGAALGETDISLMLVEPNVNDLKIFADSAGSRATGLARVGVSYMRRSLTGHRDELVVSLVRSEGNTGMSLTYSLPVSRSGTRVTAGYFNDTIKIVSGPIADLNVTGRATAWTLSARQPLVASGTMQLDGLATLKQRHTANLIDGAPLTASTLSSASLGLEMQLLDAKGYWSGSAEIVSGKNKPDGSEASSFHVARGSVRRAYNLSPHWSLNGAFNWQYAKLTLLPPSEQFQLGGEGSVRGVEPGVFSGDIGWVTNVELQRYIRFTTNPDWRTALMAFVDHGEVKPFSPQNNDREVDKLTSLGFGVNIGWKNRGQLRLTVGKPINQPPTSDAPRANVQVGWSLL
jgi:hemolysin activation/secretion protein